MRQNPPAHRPHSHVSVLPRTISNDPAPKIRTSPPLKDAIIPPDHRPPEPCRSQLALIHSHRSGIRDNPHPLRDPRRQNSTVDHPKHQNKSQHRHAAEHGEPRPPHLDAAPSSATVHGRENADVDDLQSNRESGAGDRGFQPCHLLVAGDQDAADALGEGLQDRPDVAVAV